MNATVKNLNYSTWVKMVSYCNKKLKWLMSYVGMNNINVDICSES